jgi:hypothetical protein
MVATAGVAAAACAAAAAAAPAAVSAVAVGNAAQAATLPLPHLNATAGISKAALAINAHAYADDKPTQCQILSSCRRNHYGQYLCLT